MVRLILFFCAAIVLFGQNDPRSWYERGRNYSELSQQAFEQLLKIAPESGYVLGLLGDVKFKDRQYTAALYAYNEAARRTPKLRGMHAGAAEVYTAQGKADDASTAKREEQKLGEPNCAVEKFYCLFSSGRYEDVVKAAKLKKDPEGLYWLCRAYDQLAIQSFTELGSAPESPELHAVKAQMLRDQGQYREAAEEWRTVVKLSPNDRHAQHELAASLYMSQDFKNVLPELQQFLKADPTSADKNFFVGDSLLQTEQVDSAIPYLEKAVKLDPKLLPAHASLGLCYGRLSEWQKAIPHLRAALDLDSDGSLHYQLARAYQATGQPALAKEMLAKYQELKKPAAVSAPAP
jgi:tetratricopeptide (TPR) repeat protein